MSELALYTLRKLIDNIDIETIFKEIISILNKKPYNDTIETIIYFKENNIPKIIILSKVYKYTNHKEVCNYLINSHWEELEDYLFSSDSYPTNITWKLNLLEQFNNAINCQDTLKNSIIFTDGGHNLQTKDEAWGSVVDSNGIDLLENAPESIFTDMPTRTELLPVGKRKILIAKFSDVKKQQNNGAELMALIVGLRIAENNHDIKVINCDSDLLVKYWSLGHISLEKRKSMDVRKIAYIKDCAQLRKSFETRGGRIVKIKGDDNLADLGYHKKK